MRRRDLLIGLPILAKTAAPDGRQELFGDDYLIDWMRGAEPRLGVPVEKEIVLKMSF